MSRQVAPLSVAVIPTPRPRWAWLAGLAAIAATRAGLSLIARQTGYLEYNADGYARVVHAAEWARAPRFEVDVWLPLHFWVVGGALWLWPDLTVTPLVLSGAAGLASVALLAAMAARLGGPAAGWLAGLLAAAFPWSVWFGLSGLAEAPFAAAVAAAGLGLARWLTGRRPADLWLAGAGLAVGGMLRYEGWFYGVALMLVVAPGLTAAEWRRPRLLLALALPFVFPLVWVAASQAVYGDPFAFAVTTSTITAAEGTHENLTAWERLIFYPVFFATLVWPVAAGAVLAVAGPWRRPGVVGLLTWVLGELAILALITSRFSGIGAGRDRYIMSNAVLLLPLCAVLIVGLWRWRRWGRLLAVAAVALLLWFSLATLLERRHPYPAPATVELAAALRERWAAQPPPDDALVPVEVAVPGQQDSYNERYALQVLTNRPHVFGFFWDLDLFNRLVADQAPTLWITDDRLVNPNRRAGPTQHRYGPYTLHERPPPPVIQTSGIARAGVTLRLTAQGFQPGEIVGLWLTTPEDRTIDLGQARADDRGLLDQPLTLPPRLPPGAYTLSARGARTGATGHVALPVAP